MKPMAALLILALALPAAGCARLEPSAKPYERSMLNDPVMDDDRDAVSSRHLRRVHECSEGARGGSGGALGHRSCD